MENRVVRKRKQRRIVFAVVILALGVGLWGALPNGALAQSESYSFTPLAFLCNPPATCDPNTTAPGGGNFINDFEPGAINARGAFTFVADLTTPSSGVEGVFLGRGGQLTQLARAGLLAPGGGTFAAGELGRVALNEPGDVAFAFTLEGSPPDPFSFSLSPLGFNSGVYRFSAGTNTLSAVLVPGSTPVPGGGVFVGTFFNTSLNNSGDLGFAGMLPANIGPGAPVGLGLGAFVANNRGQITTVAKPGDPAPGGGTFDFAIDPWINDTGDVAFDAHLDGEQCIKQGQDLPVFIFCSTSVYLKPAGGGIQSIAHQGEPAPGGGKFRVAFGPVMNNRGEIVFIGDLTPEPDVADALAVFLRTAGSTIAVARPGDAMPGGGHLVRADNNIGNHDLNNRGDVAFNATLDSSTDGKNADTGLYVRANGSVRLVARTGTSIPGAGTIAHLQPPFLVGSPLPHSGALINDRGEVLFQATLTDGRGVLLKAAPMPTIALPFTFSTIDPPGSKFTFPFGINPQGDIVGNYVASDDGIHGFLLHQGNFSTIDFPGSTATFARRINPQGDIVGFYFASGVTHGFLLHQGAFTPIDFPGATATLAFGINPRGDIVGWYIDSGGVNHGFLLDQGAFTTIDFPGSASTRVFGINPRGDIVGFSPASGVFHGFLLHQGAFSTIEPPGSTVSSALGINPRGDVVGGYTARGVGHGFLLHHGAFTTIDFPDSMATTATGINPEGDIVGSYVASGVTHGFLARR